MLGAPRPAGSALPTHALSCLRTLQSRRRCLPAEPGPNIKVAVNVVRGVQTDPKRRIWRETSARVVPYSHISDTTGRFWPVSMIHVHTHLESSVKHRLWIQLPSSSNVDGAWKQGLFWPNRTICGAC